MHTEQWDNPKDVENDFPKEEYWYVHVSSPEDLMGIVMNLALAANDVVTGEARWLNPTHGIMFVEKSKFSLSELQKIAPNLTVNDQINATQPVTQYSKPYRVQWLILPLLILLILLLLVSAAYLFALRWE